MRFPKLLLILSFFPFDYLNNRFYRFAGIEPLNCEAKQFCLRAFTINAGFQFLINLTTTFFVLYALDILHNDFLTLSSILVIQYIIQVVADYPTGTIGDWIGQRWVLASASFFFCLGYLALSGAVDYSSLLLAYVFLALGNAQTSGAFGAWFDNNYKQYAPEDDKRTNYIEYNGKTGMLYSLLTALAFVVGGVLVTLSSRQLIYFFQGVLFSAFSIIFLIYIRDHPAIKRESHSSTKPQLDQYLEFLKKGLAFTARNRTLRWLFLGLMISASAMDIWGSFILFPFYQSYAKTDDLTSLLRALVFIVSALSFGLISSYVKQVKNKAKVLAMSFIIGEFTFFWGFFLFLTLFPPSTSFDILKFTLVIIMYLVVMLPRHITNLLLPQFNLEIIPDQYRNSIYSLVPTLILLANVTTISFGGLLINTYGIRIALLFLGVWALIGAFIMAYAIITYQSPKIDGNTLPSAIISIHPNNPSPSKLESTPITE